MQKKSIVPVNNDSFDSTQVPSEFKNKDAERSEIEDVVVDGTSESTTGAARLLEPVWR